MVSDTGMGIEPEFLPQVFDRFTQADASTSRTHGGLGLGLSIVRHLVELHNGTVEARSDGPNQGATFVVSFPLLPRRRSGSRTLRHRYSIRFPLRHWPGRPTAPSWRVWPFRPMLCRECVCW